MGVQNAARGRSSKLRLVVLTVSVVAPVTWLTGCGSGPDLVGEAALPFEQSTDFGDGDVNVEGPAALDLTPVQQEYLDALAAAGVRPASDLRALSIGSYVCQARAAGKDEQEVREHVAPMVRSDIADSQVAAPQSAAPAKADTVVAAYIDIATQRLC